MRAFLLLTLCAVCAMCEDQEALLGVLQQWKTAWNDKNVGKTLDVYAPDSKMLKRLAAPGSREKYVANTQNFKDQLGDIVDISVGKYIESGKCYVMKVNYTIKGAVPGTFSIVKVKETWMLKSMFLTGQGEPELEQ